MSGVGGVGKDMEYLVGCRDPSYTKVPVYVHSDPEWGVKGSTDVSRDGTGQCPHYYPVGSV